MGRVAGWNEPDRDAPQPEVPRRSPQARKKNTRVYCKGSPKLGEHVREVVPDEKYAHYGSRNGVMPECSTNTWNWRRRESWTCYHHEVCQRCGKVTEWSLPKEQCPTWQQQNA